MKPHQLTRRNFLKLAAAAAALTTATYYFVPRSRGRA